jgi:hypothetical protein
MIAIGVTVALSIGVKAEDLGRITVFASDQAARASDIVGRALARQGNTYVVVVDQAKLRALGEAGIPGQVVMSEVDLEQLYLVGLSHKSMIQGTLDWDMLGPNLVLDGSRLIVQMSRAKAASVAAQYRVAALPLCRENIPIRYSPPVVSTPLADSLPGDTLAHLVSQDSIYVYNKRLEDFRTRYVFTDSIDRARDWLVSRFEGFGYTEVTIQPFWHTSWAGTGYGYNVMVVKPGYAEPDKVVLIGAHYDSYVTSQAWISAPGADDDGSGVALMMEVARILADQPLRKTVIFMAFSAEEQWMYGSGFAADEFFAAGTKLEVMFNYDMVGYTADSYWDIDVHSEIYDSYRALTAAAALRNTLLKPVEPGMSRPGDNYPFEDLGYPTVRVEESDFNTPNYHLNSDLCSNMNFPYLAEVTKMALVSLATVADAAYPAAVDGIVDLGDGQSLNISWSDCSSDCEYTVYWGNESGHYTDSTVLPADNCNLTINGLAEADSCYVLVIGESPNGYRALYGIEGAGLPLVYPRVPEHFAGTSVAAELRLELSWNANREADFSYYNVYRRIETIGVWNLYQQHVTDTTFVDYGVRAHVRYEYAVTAVDLTGHESDMSDGVLLCPATFDGGLVVADAFVRDESYNPDQQQQEAWLDSLLGGFGFGIAFSDENGGPVTLSDIGQYNTLIWCDDDIVQKNIALSEVALKEFGAHDTRMLISGYRPWANWSPNSVPVNHLLRQEFGLSYYEMTPYFDFVGAFGQNGWPSVEIDSTRGMTKWRDIPKLTPVAGAQVILTFDSKRNLAAWEGQPVGLAYETAHGKRVLFSFPLYFLTPVSAQALMTKVMEYFEFSGTFVKGDLDHSGTIDIVDVVVLLDHLFISRQPLAYPELADMDRRPGVSIGDVMVLVNYLFRGGPAPVPAN